MNKVIPKPHQIKAIAKASVYYKNNANGKLVMPCGSGKTITALLIAKSLKARLVGIVLPTLQIKSQTLKEWINVNLEDKISEYGVLLIGSNKKIGKELDVYSTVNESYITDFIIQNKHKKCLILTTYHSSYLLSKALHSAKVNLDLIIFDEAHHTVGVLNVDDFKSLMIGKFSSIKKLYMTATPKFISNGNYADISLHSMDDENIYGKEFYRLNTRKAIEQGIISDYKIVTLHSPDKAIIDAIKFNKLINADIEKKNKLVAESRFFGLAICMVKVMKKYNLKKLLAFTNTIKRAEEFSNIFSIVADALDFSSYNAAISSNNSTAKREKILNSFYKSSAGVLVNSKLFGEGFDMPAVDGVVFVDERSSNNDIIQICGRCWRKMPGKNFGYIMIPCIVNSQNELDSEDFNVMSRVITALSIDDQYISDYIKLRIGNNLKSQSNANRNDIFEELDSMPINLKHLIKKINLSVWRNYNRINEEELYWDYVTSKIWVQKNLVKHDITSSRQWVKWFNGGFPAAPQRPAQLRTNLRRIPGYVSDTDFFGNNKSKMSIQEMKDFVLDELAPLGIDSYLKLKAYLARENRIDIPKGFSLNFRRQSDYLGDTWFFDKIKWDFETSKKWIQENLVPLGISDINKYQNWFTNQPNGFPKKPKYLSYYLRRLPNFSNTIFKSN